MFYRIVENRIYDKADWKYSDDCLETSICSQEEFDKEENQGKFMLHNNDVIINPDWENIKKQNARKLFDCEFFETSLGYVRRIVKMKNGITKDFLSDILPILQAGVEIITYNSDGSQNTGVNVTDEFIQECKQQVLKDFYGV